MLLKWGSSFLLAFSSPLPWIQCLFNIPLRAVQEAPSISRRRGCRAAEHLIRAPWSMPGGWMELQTAAGNGEGRGGGKLWKRHAHFLGSTLWKYEFAVLQRKDYVGCQKTCEQIPAPMTWVRRLRHPTPPDSHTWTPVRATTGAMSVGRKHESKHSRKKKTTMLPKKKQERILTHRQTTNGIENYVLPTNLNASILVCSTALTKIG